MHTKIMEAITMKLGCDTVLFNQLDLYGALQHIAWAGYDGAQLACLANWARHIELNTNQSYMDEIKLTAKKHGLELFAIHADVGGLPGEDEITSMITMFDVARKLSIPVVTIRTWGKPDDKEDTQHIFKYVKKLTKEAENRGVTLAVGPHTGGSIYNTEKLLPLLDEINSPALGVNIDPKELYRAGDDPSETILKVGKRIVHVNLRDYPEEREPIAPADAQIIGRGVIDFPKTLTTLKNIGYDKDVNLVIIGAFTYPLSRQMGIAGEARGYLNRCLQEFK